MIRDFSFSYEALAMKKEKYSPITTTEGLLFVRTRSNTVRECVLFIGTRLSNECTPQWIRQPRSRGCVYDVCVCACVTCVLGSSRAFQPLNIRVCSFQHLVFSLHPVL